MVRRGFEYSNQKGRKRENRTMVSLPYTGRVSPFMRGISYLSRLGWVEHGFPTTTPSSP